MPMPPSFSCTVPISVGEPAAAGRHLAAGGVESCLVDLRVTVSAAPVHQRLIGAFADAMDEVELNRAGRAGRAQRRRAAAARVRRRTGRDGRRPGVRGRRAAQPGQSFRQLQPARFAAAAGVGP
ncbi:hypothetical protein [Kutzneria kofuensis]|uniref:hypothetical protein n=1 Tax=Kutzneria kofuensis TaxID=103725 RepID=UPI0031EDBD46